MNEYKNIFDNVPICIWEEDWTEVKKLLDGIRESIKPCDICEYMNANPEFVEKLISAIKILRVNQKTIDLYEANSAEELMSSLRKTFVLQSLFTFKNEIKNLYIGNTEFEEEAVTQSLNGRPLYTIIYVKFPSNESEYKNVILTMVDVTDSKNKHMLSVHKNSEKYKQLIEATNTAYVILNSEGRILESNQIFKNLLCCGENCPCLLNQPINSFINNNTLSDFNLAFEKVLNGETITSLEISMTKDTISKWFNANISMIENGEKKVFCLMTDVTQRKIEEQKKMINKEKSNDTLRNHILGLRAKIKQINNSEF